MTAIQTRNSALAIKEETVEGTPVEPTSATDYVALQDDFDMSPEFDVLENAELKASLGKSKSILGLENPTASFSHYLRHSGTEGTAPNYRLLLKNAFGSEDDAGVEHNTVAASTTLIVNVDAGEGASYLKGQCVMVKHTAFDYEIRPIESISGDALTLGFALDNAPGTGVDLGEAITYLPVDSGHPTLSVWHYLGNSGAIQMTSGTRVTEASFSFEAGQLINTSYSMEGIEYFFDPITIDATNDSMDFDDGGGEENVTVTQKTYKDPQELAAALEAAMEGATSDDITVTYSNTTGKYTIASDGGTLSLLWSSGTNTATTIGGVIGFVTGADDTLATSYEGDNAIDLTSPQTPSFDDSDPLVAKANKVFIGDATDNVCFAASTVEVTLTDTRRPIESVCAASGQSGSIINEREATVSVTALLDQYDADKFNRFRSNTETRFAYIFGSKTGNNWDAGKSGCLYLPTTTITSFSAPDDEGLIAVNIELTAFVNSDSEAEIALSFV